MSRRQPYDDRAANTWEDYVRRRFRHELKNPDVHFLRGLRHLERTKSAFCEVLVVNMKQIEEAAAISPNTITKARNRCTQLQIIDCEVGQSLLRGAATQIRRRTIKEIETGVSDVKLRNHTPTAAKEVVARLKGRNFIYDGVSVTPQIKAGKTGRISLSKPCPQIENSETRERKILSGLKPDEYLIEIDIKQAEPTVARELLARQGLAPDNWPKDIYQNLASYLGQSRDDVKNIVMPFMNAHSSVAHAKAWAILPDHFFYRLAQALDAYKKVLWSQSKPRNGIRRHVYTLGRTRIEALKGEHAHLGRLFQWQNQGTVADIMNAAMIEILNGERMQEWRLLFPVHDSVYVVTRNSEHEKLLGSIVTKSANNLGVRVRVIEEATKGSAKAR